MACGGVITPTVRQYAVVFAVNLGILNFGLAVGWTSSVMVKLADLEKSPLSHLITGSQGSWIANIVSVASIFALGIEAKLVDIIGRKYCFIIGGVLRTTNCLVLLFATELWMLILGRFISGLADGLVFGACAMYSAEIASKELRGSMGTFIQVFSAGGILIGMSVGPFVSYKQLNLLFVVLSIVSLAPTVFIPDSPYFLYKNGDKENAKKWLMFFRGNEAIVIEEMKEYDMVTDEPMKISEILSSKMILKSIGMAMLLGGGIQFTGFVNLQYFLQPLLISTGSKLSPDLASVGLGFMQLLASVTSTFITDRFRRKRILMTGLIGNMVGLFGFGLFFQLTVNAGFEVNGFLNVLPIISYIVCNIFNCCGITSIVWTIISELFDGRARGIGVALGVMTTQLFIIITGIGFPLLTEAVGPAAPFWMYIGTTAAVTIMFMVLIPETKDKTFTEIQNDLSGKKTQVEHGNVN